MVRIGEIIVSIACLTTQWTKPTNSRPGYLMLFNSFQYWVFFLIVAALFYSFPFRISKFLLLGASYIFYMWWDPRFIVLILTSTVVDYFLGIFLETASGPRKKFLLVVS